MESFTIKRKSTFVFFRRWKLTQIELKIGILMQIGISLEITIHQCNPADTLMNIFYIFACIFTKRHIDHDYLGKNGGEWKCFWSIFHWINLLRVNNNLDKSFVDFQLILVFCFIVKKLSSRFRKIFLKFVFLKFLFLRAVKPPRGSLIQTMLRRS